MKRTSQGERPSWLRNLPSCPPCVDPGTGAAEGATRLPPPGQTQRRPPAWEGRGQAEPGVHFSVSIMHCSSLFFLLLLPSFYLFIALAVFHS